MTFNERSSKLSPLSDCILTFIQLATTKIGLILDRDSLRGTINSFSLKKGTTHETYTLDHPHCIAHFCTFKLERV